MTPSIRSSLAVLALLLPACGGQEERAAPPARDAKPPPARTAPSPPPPAPAQQPATAATRVLAAGETLVIETEDTIAFPIARFEVKTGQTVRIELRKGGSMPKTAMAHNLVILRPDVNVDAFALEALGHAANDYVPPGDDERVLARTKLLGAGESDAIEFPAPAPGRYTFLCTFPGHYTLMRGEMVVR